MAEVTAAAAVQVVTVVSGSDSVKNDIIQFDSWRTLMAGCSYSTIKS